MSVLLENTSLVKFIRNYILDSSGVFSKSTSSLVKISLISLISSSSLKLFLNLLVYDRNIFGSSSKVSSNLRQSPEIFGKYSGTFVWPSESVRKSSENRQKRCHQYVYIIKQHYTLARRFEFYVLVARTISHE